MWVTRAILVLLLVAVVAVGVAAGVSIGGYAVVALAIGVWVAAAIVVQRDARRLGVVDDELVARRVFLWGLPGLLWWFGYRRGRADAGRG